MSNLQNVTSAKHACLHRQHPGRQHVLRRAGAAAVTIPRWALVAALTAGLCALTANPLPAQEQAGEALPEGRIVGRIVGHPEAGRPVMLLQIRLDEQGQPTPSPIGRSETTEGGAYLFTGVPIDPLAVYQLGTRIDGRLVGSDPFTFHPGSNEVVHDLQPPGTLKETSALSFDEALIVIEPRAGAVSIVEVIHFHNPTSDVLETAGTPLELPVAPEADGLEIMRLDLDDAEHEWLGPKLLVHGKIPPGPGVIAFRYTASALLGSLDWVRFYPRAVNRLKIISPKGGGLRVSGGGLEPRAEEVFDGVAYAVWLREEPTPQSPLEITVSGLPIGQWMLLLPAGAFLVVMAGLVAWFLRRRLAGVEAVAES